MTDRPILFSAPMIRALLDGRKTQARRVLNLPKKTHSGGPIYERKDMGGWEATTIGGGGCFTIGRDGSRCPAPERVGIWHQTTGTCMVAPYQPGDRLWVREAHALVPASAYRCSEGVEQAIDPVYPRQAAIYRAGWERSAPGVGWRPSIHMPRWASRLTLNVTDVRVQRVQEISEDDARAEGSFLERCDCSAMRAKPKDWVMASFRQTACAYHGEEFRYLWNHLNASRGYGWEANPWVVAVTFSVERRNIDAPAA